MSESLHGVVVTHGNLAGALLEAVERITGDSAALVAVSNDGCDRDRLSQEIETAVGSGPAVVFVDLPSGSCLQASVAYLRSHEGVSVVAGVNLAMLLDFVYHLDATPHEAAERAVQTGGRAIRVLE